jgi:TrmH RNA methyltransferase
MKEIKYYGIHSCLALFKTRKEDIVRVYVNEGNVFQFKHLLKWCSQNKKAYHIVSDPELEKVTTSVHHEGICILAKELGFVPWEIALAEINKTKSKGALFYLDGVQNPHNIGSIIRVLAHFGVPYILGEKGKLPPLSPSAYRIAKGGAEFTRLVAIDKPVLALKALKQKGFSLITTSSHEGSSIYRYQFPEKSLIIMGSESDGVSKNLFQLAENKIQIPGTGHVESLNVSVATALCIAEFSRQHA